MRSISTLEAQSHTQNALIGAPELAGVVQQVQRWRISREKLGPRCTTVGEVCTAKAPPQVRGKKYDKSAALTVAVLKNGHGFLFPQNGAPQGDWAFACGVDSAGAGRAEIRFDPAHEDPVMP